jgi:hypothetical protein
MFLIAQYLKTPNDKVCTSAVKFWSNPDNYSYSEMLDFVRNVRNSDLTNANVILDLKNKEVVKCRGTKETPLAETNRNFQEIYDYFYHHYPETLDKIHKMMA